MDDKWKAPLTWNTRQSCWKKRRNCKLIALKWYISRFIFKKGQSRKVLEFCEARKDRKCSTNPALTLISISNICYSFINQPLEMLKSTLVRFWCGGKGARTTKNGCEETKQFPITAENVHSEIICICYK